MMVNKFQTLKDSRVKRDILIISRIIKVGLVIALGNTLCVNAAPITTDSELYIIENNKLVLGDDYVHGKPDIEKNVDSLYSEDSGTEDPVDVFINNEDTAIEETSVGKLEAHKVEIINPLSNLDMDIRRKKRYIRIKHPKPSSCMFKVCDTFLSRRRVRVRISKANKGNARVNMTE